MRLRLFIPAVAALLFTLQAQAQSYEPGLLVRANGDTLRGEIENDFWLVPPTFVRFRATPTSPSEVFKPRKLRMFRLTGGRYFRYVALPIDHAAETRLDRLPTGYHPNVQIDSVMAEVLLDGPANLLRVVKFSTTHFVVRRPGQPPLDLSEQKYLRTGFNGVTHLTDGNNYRALLSVYFGDCPAADQAAQVAPFTPEGLASVVQAYNGGCTLATRPTQSMVAQSEPRRRVAFQGGLVAGGRSDRITQELGPLSRQFNGFGGLYGEVFLPNRSIAIYGELSASRFHSQGRTVAYVDQVSVPTTGGGTYITYRSVYSYFDYRAWLGTARIGLRYFFQLPHEQQWFFGFGLEVNHSLFPTYTTTSGPSATPNHSDLDYDEPLPRPNASLGWRNRRLTVGIDAQLDATYRLGLSYRLNGNPDVARPATR